MKETYEVNGSACFTSCTTPLSQASTAPPTPAGGPLPEPLWVASLLSSPNSSLSRKCDQVFEEDDEELDVGHTTSFGMPPLQSKLAIWAQAVAQAESWLQVAQEDDCLSQDLENVEVEDDVEDCEEIREPVYCIGMPPLQSKLALWAEAVIYAEEWLQVAQEDDSLSQDLQNMEVEDDFEDWDEPLQSVQCIGMHPLQSNLGRWAEAVVKAEIWLHKEMAQYTALKAHAECLQSELGLAAAFEVRQSDFGQ